MSSNNQESFFKDLLEKNYLVFRHHVPEPARVN